MGVEIERPSIPATWEFYGNYLSGGVESMPIDAINSSTNQTVSGAVYFAYFTPMITVTCANALTYSGGTAAAATPTVCRVGFYTVAANGDLTLVARTENTTSLWSGTNAEYVTEFDTTGGYPASYTFVAGVRYAGAMICVTGTTAPQLRGSQSATSAHVARAPRKVGVRTGEADLAASYTSGLIANTSTRMYIAAIA